nr:hypothetical protein [uncultured bacterium]
MLFAISSARARDGTDDRQGRTIAGQYGSSPGQKQQMFGRVDPFCLFAVLPMLTIAGFFIWGGIAIVGVVLIFLAILIVVIDSWANRPVKKPAPRYRDDR